MYAARAWCDVAVELRVPRTAQLQLQVAGIHLPRDSVRVSGALRSLARPILTEIYLCHACSCHEIEEMETPPRPGRGRLSLGMRALPRLGALPAAHAGCLGRGRLPRHGHSQPRHPVGTIQI
jgi:hypothetical protein